jgi:hypothetical protein
MNTLAQLGASRSSPMTTLASMGQRYRDLPPATFDQRFGPYQAPGPTPDSRDQLRRLMEEQMLRNTPEGIVPGTKTWPYGYTQTSAQPPQVSAPLQSLIDDVMKSHGTPSMGPYNDQPTDEALARWQEEHNRGRDVAGRTMPVYTEPPRLANPDNPNLIDPRMVIRPDELGGMFDWRTMLGHEI